MLYRQHGNRMKLSQFTNLYPQQFHEMLPASRDNNLLKYLVQLPRILVIKCIKDDDIMIFCSEQSSHRTVIDILRHDQEIWDKENNKENNNSNNKDGNIEYKGMRIDQFTLRLAEKLNIHDLSDCNIVDFLARWRVVELCDNNKYVRLMPMGCCTVFLGNLNPTQWNENKVRTVLTQINQSWFNLRIRLNQTNYGLLNAFVDFKSMQQAQSAIGLIKNHLTLFENANGSYDPLQHGMNNNGNTYPPAQHGGSGNNDQAASPSSHGSGSPSQHGIRVEIEQASAHKNHSSHGHNYHNYYYQYPQHHGNNNSGNNTPGYNASMTKSPNSMNKNHHNNRSPHYSHSHTNSPHHNNHHNHHNHGSHTHPSTPVRNNHGHNNNNQSPHSNHRNNNHNDHDNNNNNNVKNDNFSRITNNIYKLIREHGGQMLMSNIAIEYKKLFNKELQFDGNPKYFVKMERLLLLNCDESRDDVMIFFTPEPAYKLVVTILKQNPSGLTVEQFRNDLERRMNMSLNGCDFNDFLMRWRFLSIRETKDNKKMVLFTPHSGSTVFFGNLNVECTENDIYNDLEEANAKWKHSSVRLKLGKGFAYAFVDFPTRQDAMDAVQHFDGKSAFKSKYVSADIEAIEQRKRHHHGNHHHNNNNHNHKHNGYNHKGGRTRSYSHGNSPQGYHHNNHYQGNNNRRNNNNGRQYNHGSNDRYHNNHNGSSHHYGSSNNGHNNQHRQHRSNKTTVYLGNLRDDVTKNDIQNELRNFNEKWNNLTIRLNLRSGWSHAFVDFELSSDARKLINAWNNRPNSLTTTRLRCEISKRQM